MPPYRSGSVRWASCEPFVCTGAELANLPVQCSGGGAPALDSLPNQSLSALHDVKRRDYADDPFFMVTAGLVKNATDLVDTDPDLKPSMPPEAEFDVFRELIYEIHDEQWVPGSVWTIISGAPYMVTSARNVATAMGAAVKDPAINYTTIDTEAEATAATSALQNEWNALSSTEHADRMRYLERTSGLLTNAGPGRVRFTSTGTIQQTLHRGSAVDDQVHVVVLARLTAATSMLKVQIEGFGLRGERDLSGNLGTVSLHFDVSRVGMDAAVNDLVRIEGTDVDLFRVSVLADAPAYNPATGSFYELLLLEGGTDWATAANIAKSMTYDGIQAQLAIFDTTSERNFVRDAFDSDVAAWVGALSEDGSSAASFEWQDGSPVDPSLWAGSVGFTSDRRRGAFVLASPATQNLDLLHASPSVTLRDLPLGFYVEYDTTGQSLLGLDEGMSNVDGLTECSGVDDACISLAPDEEAVEDLGPIAFVRAAPIVGVEP